MRLVLIIFGFLVTSLLLNVSAYALSDADYENLKSKSSEFAEADKRLGETWKKVRANLSEEANNSLRSEQRDWIKSGWDARANELMNDNDLPKSQAYTQAINERIKYLENYYSSNAGSSASASRINNDKIIEVDASGLGSTKNDALEDAWMDAVRKAVGVYLSGKTEVNNDELKERILAHSRGQVKSYKETSSSFENGMWKVNIIALIDKDILRVPEKNTSTQKLSFDGTDIAAQDTTTIKKNKSGTDLAVDAARNIDFKKMINYKSELITLVDRQDKKAVYLWNTIFINLNNYKTELDPFEKAISQCAVKANKVQIGRNDSAKSIFRLLSNPNLINNKPKSVRELTITDVGEPYGIGWMRKPYSDSLAVCFHKNISSGVCYEIGSDLFNQLLTIFKKKL